MKWYYFSFAILGILLSNYYSIKALRNLSELGREKSIFVCFFFTIAKDEYFSKEGLKFKKLSLLMVVLAFLGFFVGAILTAININNFK